MWVAAKATQIFAAKNINEFAIFQDRNFYVTLAKNFPAGTRRIGNVVSTSMQRHDVATSWRCIDVDTTLNRRFVPDGFVVLNNWAQVFAVYLAVL